MQEHVDGMTPYKQVSVLRSTARLLYDVGVAAGFVVSDEESMGLLDGEALLVH